jgi:hypothetical protein
LRSAPGAGPGKRCHRLDIDLQRDARRPAINAHRHACSYKFILGADRFELNPFRIEIETIGIHRHPANGLDVTRDRFSRWISSAK